MTTDTDFLDLEAVYVDLHRNPELPFAEHRTASVVARHLQVLGFEVHTGVGGTGVVGVLSNGPGSTVLLRADMDALPIAERTGLAYASVARGIGLDGQETPVMHACGHDVHVTCLLGAGEWLVRNAAQWRGTAVLLFQPAEELAQGALAMVAGGLYDLVPSPDVILAQHVGPHPAGIVGAHAGPALASTDTLKIRLIGRGGHGARPETTIDPVLMAAATILRLQAVVSREVAAQDMAVVTVGSVHGGTKGSIIPAHVDLEVSVRTLAETVRRTVLASIRRIVAAEVAASGPEAGAEITLGDASPVTINDVDATRRVMGAFAERFGGRAMDPGTQLASEDVMHLAEPVAAPVVYWFFGGGDPDGGAQESNHSPRFAPVPHPTIEVGVEALTTAALVWLQDGLPQEDGAL